MRAPYASAGPRPVERASSVKAYVEPATVERMGRSNVAVRVGSHRDVEREPALAVHLALGVPANERMDWLVEKAAELGVASLQPLVSAPLACASGRALCVHCWAGWRAY